MKLTQVTDQYNMLNISNKKLEDEKRNIERTINKVKTQKEHLVTNIQELKLENEMSTNDLTTVL
jgi:hypothetical protein